jgi:rod shape-determining protein MreC
MRTSTKRTDNHWLTQTWAVPVVAAGAIILHYSGMLSPLENLALSVVQPFQAFAYEATVEPREKEELAELSRDDLETEYLRLQDTLQNAKVENTYLRTVTEEANLLEEQMDFLRKRSFESRTAKVVSRSSEGLARSIVLNKGEDDGITAGYPVITGNGILVGSIESTSDTTSIARLVTSYDALTSGAIQNDKKSPGVLRGSLNLGMAMGYIPQGHAVSVGDMVITSGADALIPRGLIVGEVEQVRDATGSVFQTAEVRPLFEAEDTFIVSVIIP